MEKWPSCALADGKNVVPTIDAVADKLPNLLRAQADVVIPLMEVLIEIACQGTVLPRQLAEDLDQIGHDYQRLARVVTAEFLRRRSEGQGSAELPSESEAGSAGAGLDEIRQAVAELTARVERIEAVRPPS